PYRSEEEFWEEVVGVKRRTAYQMIAIGRVLRKIGVQPEGTKALASVGLYKMDLLVSILEREPTEAALERWAEVASTRTRSELREQVHQALGRPVRTAAEPGSRFERMVELAMPDQESRALAEDFFRVGKEYVGSENAVGVMIAAMQECLASWPAHTAM